MILHRFIALFMPKVHFGFLGSIGGAVASSVVGGLLGGSSGGGSSKSTATNEPWKAQQPHLKRVFNEAQSLYNQGTPDYYDGQLNAGVNSNLQQAFNQAQGVANDQGFLGGLQGAVGAMGGQENVYDQSLANQISDNPFVQQSVDALTADVNRNAATQIAQNNMNAGMMGNTGSSGAAVQNALVQQDANRAIADASLGLRNNAYNQGVSAGFQGAGNRLTSLGMQSNANLGGLQTAYSQANNQINNLMTTGMSEYGIGQDSIAAELAKWDYNTNAAWDNLNKYRSMVSGNYGGSSTQSTPNPVSTAQGFLGGATAGLGLWEKFK